MIDNIIFGEINSSDNLKFSQNNTDYLHFVLVTYIIIIQGVKSFGASIHTNSDSNDYASQISFTERVGATVGI